MDIIINLDKQFSPVEGIEMKYEMFQFPGGEWHIKLEKQILQHQPNWVRITHRIKSMDDLMQVAIAKDAIEDVYGNKNSMHLVMPYIPYARQDRRCVDEESFSLKVFTDFLNLLKFDRVTVLDPHSDVAIALINNVDVIDNHEFIKKVLTSLAFTGYAGQNYNLISVDAGSNKKIYKLASYLSGITATGGVTINGEGFFGGKDRIIKCDKIRDAKTGKLSGFEVYDNDLRGMPCFIVDDICDGGGTFIGLAKELKKKNAGDIILAVSHGIFSKEFDELGKHIDHIYTTDSFRTIDCTFDTLKHVHQDFVTQIKFKI